MIEQKVNARFVKNKEKYVTLQSIVQEEIDKGMIGAPNSTAGALMWLKRALEFIREMLHGLLDTPDELSMCRFARH